MSNMYIVKCPYCKKDNKVISKKAIKKTCKPCLRWAKIIKNKTKIDREDKIRMVNWLTKQKQECTWCGSKKRLGVDRIIPNSKGGTYRMGNIQIMCYDCNCTKKIDYISFKEAQKDHIEKICKICKKVYPLTNTYWHKTTYKTKIRKNSKSHWHGTCRTCRLKIEKNKYLIECIFCKEKKRTWTQKAKYCSRRCMYSMRTENAMVEIECAYCSKKIIITKSSKRKYCNNKCSAKNMEKKNGKFIKSKLN